MTKVSVSSSWTEDERADVVSAIRIAIADIDAQVSKRRKTVLYEAPCFAEWAVKKAVLEQLIRFVASMPSHFLELNRRNYREFVE